MVEATGHVLVDGIERKITLRLRAEICSPISVNSCPLEIELGTDSPKEFCVRRESISREKFLKIQCLFPPGFHTTELFHDENEFSGLVRCSSGLAGDNVMLIMGLAENISIPIVVVGRDKIVLLQDIVIAKRHFDEWIAEFSLECNDYHLLGATIQNGRTLPKPEIADGRTRIVFTESDFDGGFCNVSFEFRSPNGRLEKIDGKVWKEALQ
jgi:hypothetical protein